jgi:hypothetical protein
VADQLGIVQHHALALLLKGHPFLALPELVEPVDAQPLRGQRVAVTRQKGLHLGLRRLAQPRAQLPVGDVRIQGVLREAGGQAVELVDAALLERLARGQEGVVLLGRTGRQGQNTEK